MDNSIAPPLPTSEPPTVDDPLPLPTSTPMVDLPTIDGDKTVTTTPLVNGNPVALRADPVQWLQSLATPALHKVNFYLLNWLNSMAEPDADQRISPPGTLKESTTKNQFLGFLRDGTVLAKLAKRFQPGTEVIVKEGEEAKEKSNQLANIDAFLEFVKQRVGLSDDQVFPASALLDEGKPGYVKVFKTIAQLAMNTSTTLGVEGIQPEKLVEVASQAVRFRLLDTILRFFRRGTPSQAGKLDQAEKTNKEKLIEEEENHKSEQVICTVMEPKPTNEIAAH